MALAAVLVIVLVLLYFRPRPNTDAEQAALLLRQFPIRPGMSVADVGAGDGRFAFRLAQALGDSVSVYVTEIDRKHLVSMRANHPGNVSVIEGANDSARLPDNCCDLVYLRRVFHHFSDPAPMNASLFRAVCPGGAIAVIDAPARLSFNLVSPQLDGPRNRWWHGISSKSVAGELRAAGFSVQRIMPWPDRNYCVIGKKPKI